MSQSLLNRGTNSTRQLLQEENRMKVQRLRAEKAFMQSIAANYTVEHLHELQEQVRNENREVSVKREVHRVRIPQAVDAREGFSELKRFGSNIRICQVTQGGATLWTATESGSIEIHSGKDGLLVYTIGSVPQDTQVECMMATATHMWVGLSDGTVQVYDHMVFLHITEGKFHNSRVTAFCPTFDGRMYSASGDGVLVRWDTEEKTFEAMSKITTSLPSITALAAHNYRLYAAASDGQILCLDVENASALSTIFAHTDAITAAVVVDGSLFTAGRDNKLKVWSCLGNEPAPLSTVDIESPVVAFAPDSSSHRLLIGHEDGTIDLMSTMVEDGFAIEQTFAEFKGRSLKALHSMTAIDSLKIWSLASNGVNKVWFSSKNKVATEMEETINSLKAVIKQDTVELDKWRTLVFRLKCINARRKIQTAASLLQYHKELLRRRYMWNWRQYLHKQTARRRRVAISARLGLDEHVAFVRRYFVNWFRWYRYTQNNRLKVRYADLLVANSQKNATLYFFRKLQSFSRHMKLSMKRSHSIRVIAEHNTTSLIRTYFRKLLKYRHTRKLANQKMVCVATVLRSSQASLRRLFYMRWLHAAQRHALRERRRKFGETLQSTNVRGLRLGVFQKWVKYVQRNKDLKRKMAMTSCLVETTNRSIQQQYYSRWLLFRAKMMKEQAEERRVEVEADVQKMREKYAQLQHIIDEKKALDDIRRQITKETDDLETRRIKYDQLQQEKAERIQKIAARDFEALQKGKSVQEQMMSLMANLKAKVINFHTDFQLMHQIREKLRSNHPVTKIFLEAHQQVKRVVVEVTKRPHLSGAEEWPLTLQAISRMPPHSLTVLLTAIKTMIITFDVMDKATRDSLQSDAEIVLNAKWIMAMAEHCVSYRKKTLGHK